MLTSTLFLGVFPFVYHVIPFLVALQAVQATAAAEATRKANSSQARIELEEQMKERQLLILQQQVSRAAHLGSLGASPCMPSLFNVPTCRLQSTAADAACAQPSASVQQCCAICGGYMDCL